MYNIRKIREGIISVGVNDRKAQRFENMFPLPEGVSYNSFLILGEKTCLMDAVDASETLQFLHNVEAALDGRPLDYLVVQHMEPDHCGSIEQLLLTYPAAKLVGNSKTFTLFEQFYTDKLKDRYHLIQENDSLDLGGFFLQFIFAPMVHWPEVFMSYEKNTKTFFSADAFGSFGCIKGNLFADELDYCEHDLAELRRYYVNIVGRHGQSVQRLFAKIEKLGLEIDMICPVHSLCFRTPETIHFIMEKYRLWSAYEAEEKGVVMAFSSMYGNTALAMDVLAGKLAERGVRGIRLYDVSQTHPSYVVAEIWRYNTVVFAGMNYNTELYFVMDGLIKELIACGFQKRQLALLVNMSWGGRAQQIMQEYFKAGKELELIAEPFVIKSSLKAEQLPALDELADKIAAASIAEQRVSVSDATPDTELRYP